MAIYHLSASIIKRSAGRSVVAAAAYRAGSKIEDLTTGIVHDYTRKQGIDHREVISPVSIDKVGNEWLLDREQLWNKIEEIEKRKDAQLAREITIAIPVELDRASQIELVREYVRVNFVQQGMIADINLHHLNGNNPHGHILLTMRNLQTTPEGKVEFGLKNTDWNSKDLLLAQRKSWEEITNKYLAAAGSETKIDCRSLEEQGSPFIPQIHVGVHATAMKRNGIATNRGDEFDRIKAENNDIRANLERIYREEAAPESDSKPDPKQYPKNENEHKLGKLLDELLQKWGQRIFYPEDIKLVFYKIRPDQISIYIDEYPPQSTRISSFKLIDDRWIKTVQPKDARYSIDNLITIVSEQHHRFDTEEIKKLELNDLERREITCFRDWCGLELNDSRLATIREKGKEIISNSLADKLVKWIDKNIPSTSEILTKDKIKELADSAQPFTLIHNSNPNSVYTEYILLDTQQNKSLEIRYNRGRLERISGVVTPLISERIKVIINELENADKVMVKGMTDIERQISTPTSLPEASSGDVVSRITLISQKLANQDEQKLEKPETIKSQPAMKPESEFKPASEDLKSVIAESDPIVEQAQPIKVAEINQPTIKRATKTKIRRPDRGGR